MNLTKTLAATVSAIALVGCGSETPPSVPSQPREVASEPADQASPTDDHIANLYDMGNRMLALRYHSNDRGSPLTETDLGRAIASGVSHIYVPNTASSEMQWRLTGHAFPEEGPNSVPVSFLEASSKLPIDERFVTATTLQFTSIASSLIPPESIRLLAEQAYARFSSVRSAEPNNAGDWLARSDVRALAPENRTKGQYAVRIDLQEWPDEGSRMTVYFIFVSEGRQVDFSKVTGSGFSH